MRQLFRKIRSASSMILHEKPLEAIFTKTEENIRQYIVQTKKGQPFIYRTRMGFEFICLPEVMTSVNLFVRQQQYEEIELQIAKEWLCTGDYCLDLGANVGYFTALLAAKVGLGGKVIAVEAAPQTAKHLQQVVEMLNLRQVQLEQVCVTDKEGLVEFMTSCEAGLDVRQSLTIGEEFEGQFKKEIIRSISLNQIIEKYQAHQKIALVKMDIEAAEPLALKGGSSLFALEALPMFIVEVYKLGLQRMGFTPKDIYQWFLPDQFNLYVINRSYPNPTPEIQVGVVYPLDQPEDHHWGWHTNLLAVPKIGRYSNRSQLFKSCFSRNGQ